MTTVEADVVDLPEFRDNPFIAKLPPLMPAIDILRALADPPIHQEAERNYPAHLRAECVHRLGRYFEPLERHLQLASKFATLLRQGYISRNPLGADFIHRLQDGHERVTRRELNVPAQRVRSTASSFALVGCSGIGKSKSVERVLELYPQTIHHSEPFSLDQVVWLKLDCPFMGSPKQLCISFFKEMDKRLGTNYLGKHGSGRKSIDEMMVHMAHVANLHALGVLIIDEIQHLRQARGPGPDALLNFLVTLVNTIGIPVIIIGTLGALPLLQGDFRQARRASGLGSMVWERLEAGPTWNHFVERLWRYQWLREVTPLTDEIREVLYDESQGIIDVVIKLFMLGQLHALQLGMARPGMEKLTVGLLRHVAKENFRLIHPMIDALKRGDRKAIERYDDIRPLQDHVEEVFSSAMVRLNAASAPQPRSVVQVSQGGDEAILQALQAAGVAPDIARRLMAEVAAEHPELGTLDQISLIADKLRQRPPEPAPPPKKRARRSSEGTLIDGDLRVIVAKGKEAGQSGYEALLAVGVARSPLEDFAA